MARLLSWIFLLLSAIPFITLTSCSDNDDENQSLQELIIGKWICYDDAYGDPWDEPLVIVFDSDGTGYLWFQDEPFSNRYEFTYTITETKIRIVEEDDDNDDGYYITNLVYMISNNGKSLLLNGWDDDDMEELYFTKQ